MKFNLNIRAGIAVMLLSVPLLGLGMASSCGTGGPPIIEPLKRCGDGSSKKANNEADTWCKNNTACAENEEGYCPYDNEVANGSGSDCVTFCSKCECKTAGFTDPRFDEGELQIIASPSVW